MRVIWKKSETNLRNISPGNFPCQPLLYCVSNRLKIVKRFWMYVGPMSQQYQWDLKMKIVRKRFCVVLIAGICCEGMLYFNGQSWKSQRPFQWWFHQYLFVRYSELYKNCITYNTDTKTVWLVILLSRI